jgi:hypothetical protein
VKVQRFALATNAGATELVRGMNDIGRRCAFANFLEQLASSGSIPREQWQTFVVTHYPDDALEEIRRQCVRLAISVDERNDWSEGERLQLKAWELRKN